MKNIINSVNINAPKEKVWNVLTQDKYTRAWYNEFSAGTYAETDWSIGSKAIFRDKGQDGLIAKIVENIPGEVLSIEYTGMLLKGNEDYDSPIAQSVKGGRETYKLSEKNGITQLDTSATMDEGMYDTMAASWKKALQKITELSENEH